MEKDNRFKSLNKGQLNCTLNKQSLHLESGSESTYNPSHIGDEDVSGTQYKNLAKRLILIGIVGMFL